MASIFIGVGVLSYDQIKKQRQKRAAKKAHNTARFSELERENARRIDAFQNNTYFYQQSDWQGGGCERHGYVPAAGTPSGPPGPEDAGPPAYGEGEAFAPKRRESHPRGEGGEYIDASMVDGASGDGLAQVHGRRNGRGEEGEALLNDKPRAPVPMQENEVARINEKRRKSGASEGLKRWRLRRKSGKEEGFVR